MKSRKDIEDRVTEIEAMMNSNDFWTLPHSSAIVSEYSRLQKRLESDVEIDMSGEFDDFPAIVSIMSGAGGDDAEDFTRMLLGMYLAFSHNNNLTLTLLKSNENDNKGYRSVSVRIEGDSAFKKLQYESGVHRLIRISPFNAKGKRQTSFSMVEVIPEIVHDNDVHLNPEDLDIQFTKSGGAGGQNVNKRETAVRITHKPTGLSVRSESGRTQEGNKEEALSVLRGKLAIILLEEQNSEITKHQISKTVDNEWGNQIRTYTLNPYKLVKDHRTGVESTNVDAVLEKGEIEFLTKDLINNSIEK